MLQVIYPWFPALSLISFINVSINAFVPVVNYLSYYIETSRYIRLSSMPAIAFSIRPVAIWAPRPPGHIMEIFGPWRRFGRLYENNTVGDLRGRSFLWKEQGAEGCDCRFWYHLRLSMQNASILTHMKLSLKPVQIVIFFLRRRVPSHSRDILSL